LVNGGMKKINTATLAALKLSAQIVICVHLRKVKIGTYMLFTTLLEKITPVQEN